MDKNNIEPMCSKPTDDGESIAMIGSRCICIFYPDSYFVRVHASMLLALLLLLLAGVAWAADDATITRGSVTGKVTDVFSTGVLPIRAKRGDAVVVRFAYEGEKANPIDDARGMTIFTFDKSDQVATVDVEINDQLWSSGAGVLFIVSAGSDKGDQFTGELMFGMAESFPGRLSPHVPAEKISFSIRSRPPALAGMLKSPKLPTSSADLDLDAFALHGGKAIGQIDSWAQSERWIVSFELDAETTAISGPLTGPRNLAGQQEKARTVAARLFGIDEETIDDADKGLNYDYNQWGAHPEVNIGRRCDAYRDGHSGVDIQTKDVAGDKTADRNFFSLTKGHTIAVGADKFQTIAVYDPGRDQTALYLHSRQVFVELGAQVEVGDMLGIQGDFGVPGSEHVHFEIRNGRHTSYACGASDPTSLEPNGQAYQYAQEHRAIDLRGNH